MGSLQSFWIVLTGKAWRQRPRPVFCPRSIFQYSLSSRFSCSCSRKGLLSPISQRFQLRRRPSKAPWCSWDFNRERIILTRESSPQTIPQHYRASFALTIFPLTSPLWVSLFLLMQGRSKLRRSSGFLDSTREEVGIDKETLEVFSLVSGTVLLRDLLSEVRK